MSFAEYLIRFCGHDEIIAVQAFDFVGPPADLDFTPFRCQGGMMVFRFRQLTYRISKRQCIDKVFEYKRSMQLLDAVGWNNFPFLDVIKQSFCFFVAYLWRAGVTNFTVGLSQIVRYDLLPQVIMSLSAYIGQAKDP